MKAVLCKQYGPPETLVVEDMPSPVAGPGQVVIAVRACSVQFADSLFIQGKYQVKVPPPFSPGSQVAGVVKQLGPGVGDFRPGDRVLAFTYWGGYAEEVAVDASRLSAIPEGMDYATATTIVSDYSTSLHGLRDRAALAPGETLLVLGAAGGVGLAAVQLGKIMGARVIAAASSAEKLAVCRANGADALINYSVDDLRERIKTLTGGRGIDVVYDPVGGKLAEPALRSMAHFGRYLVVGFASGEIPRLPLNLPLLKMVSVVGVFWSEFAVSYPNRQRIIIGDLLRWFQEGKYRPYISATYPLERASAAITDVAQRRVSGRVVLLIGAQDALQAGHSHP